MGRRSRKRTGAASGAGASPPLERAPARTSRRPSRAAEERPPAPWGPVPVTEIAIGAGLLAIVVSFARGSEGTVPLIVGFAVCALAVFELVSREHFAGVRSHTLLLSLGPVVVLEAILFAAGLRGPALLAAALAAYVALFVALRARFRRARDRRALAR